MRFVDITKNITRRVKCLLCAKGSVSRSEFQSHARTHAHTHTHTLPLLTLWCPVCVCVCVCVCVWIDFPPSVSQIRFVCFTPLNRPEWAQQQQKRHAQDAHAQTNKWTSATPATVTPMMSSGRSGGRQVFHHIKSKLPECKKDSLFSHYVLLSLIEMMNKSTMTRRKEPKSSCFFTLWIFSL